MATFTMTLAEIFGDEGIETVSDAVASAGIIGLDLYSIEDESYRDVLNEKIIRRYWNREIAHESPDMFRFRMFAVLNEEMPWYNQMLKSTQIKFDPMMTMDLKTIADNRTTNTSTDTSHATSSDDTNTDTTNTEDTLANATSNTDTTRTEGGTDLSTNTSDTGSRTVNSITPQNQLSGNGDYADSMADTTTEGKNTSNSSRTGEGEENAATVDESTENKTDIGNEKTKATGETTANQTGQSEQDIALDTRTSGYQAVPADLLRKYRDTIINVDVMLLNKLSTLFMIVTTNGDEYFHSRPQFTPQGFFLGGYY